jgi:hypothetical protein
MLRKGGPGDSCGIASNAPGLPRARSCGWSVLDNHKQKGYLAYHILALSMVWWCQVMGRQGNVTSLLALFPTSCSDKKLAGTLSSSWVPTIVAF